MNKIKKQITISVPCFNEEGNILSIIDKVRRVVGHTDIVVVNDGSADSTALLAQKAGVTVISHPINLGDGAFISTCLLQ